MSSFVLILVRLRHEESLGFKKSFVVLEQYQITQQ